MVRKERRQAARELFAWLSFLVFLGSSLFFGFVPVFDVLPARLGVVDTKGFIAAAAGVWCLASCLPGRPHGLTAGWSTSSSDSARLSLPAVSFSTGESHHDDDDQRRTRQSALGLTKGAVRRQLVHRLGQHVFELRRQLPFGRDLPL